MCILFQTLHENIRHADVRENVKRGLTIFAAPWTIGIMETPSHLWDQQADEPDDDFAKFCTYLALGPSRSIRRAELTHLDQKKANKSERKSRSPQRPWTTVSIRFRWRDRADAWDAENGRRAVEMATHDYANTFRALLRQLNESLEAGIKPKTYTQAIDAFVKLAAHYAPIEAAAGTEMESATNEHVTAPPHVARFRLTGESSANGH